MRKAVKTACFFARVRDPELFSLVEFYRQDIRILSEIGFDVTVCNGFSQIPRHSDLYFTWWWDTGALALIKSLIGRRPNIFTGVIGIETLTPRWEELRFPLKQVSKNLFRFTLRNSSINLATSELERKWLIDIGAPRVELVYPAVDASEYHPGPDGEREDLVLLVSHLDAHNIKRKQIANVIRAFGLVHQRHPHMRLVVAGGKSPGFEQLEQVVDELKLQSAISFPGRISTQEKIDLYRRARVYVSQSLYEGFGAAIAEAMSCGLPVVVSPVGSVPEVVGDCGLYSSADDLEQIAGNITRLLTDSSLWRQLSDCGRGRILSMFDYSIRREKLRAIIEEIA